jgi:nicotinamide-nucleotide amidase
VNVCCIIVGDEILSGHVQDANGHFIASRLAATGHRLVRISVVSDAPEAIGDAIRSDIAARPSMIFVCGGLGPTHDDRTMEAIATTLDLELEPCRPIADRIERLVARMRSEGFSEDPLGVAGLQKMALAPAGAEFLRCDSGVIPAVTLVHDGVRFFILPGPPRELQSVFVQAVEPSYLEPTGSRVSRIEIEHLFPESSLASALIEIEAAHPGVTLGSYPQADHVIVRIAGPQEDVTAAAQRLRDAIERLETSDEGRRLLDFIRARRMNAES